MYCLLVVSFAEPGSSLLNLLIMGGKDHFPKKKKSDFHHATTGPAKAS